MHSEAILPAIRNKTDLAGKIARICDIMAYKRDSMDNLAEDIIRGKERFLKASLEQILGLIAEREIAKQANIRSIDSEMTRVQAKLSLYQCIVYPISPDHKRKSNLERALSDLENSRRQEEIDCWQDTMKLWQELLKIAGYYRAAVRKRHMIIDS